MTRFQRIIALMLLLLASVTTFHRHDFNYSQPEVVQMVMMLDRTVDDLNAKGRVPLDGRIGGAVNNIVQVTKSDPTRLGCGGQAFTLKNQLEGAFPHWRFEIRYAVGIDSPILLPHQWVVGHSPDGHTIVNLDPWANDINVEKS